MPLFFVILNGFNDVAFQFEHQTSLSTLSAIFIKQDYCSTQRSAMAGDNSQTVISKTSILWAWWEKISAEIVRINMPLEKPFFCLLCYIISLQDQNTKQGLWMSSVAMRGFVWLWSWGDSRGWQKIADKWGMGDCVGVGWDGIMSDILWNLYLQSRDFFHANETHLIRICLMGHMRNMRRLIPSLVFRRADWQRPERARRRACLQNPILICLMVSGSQKSQISCQLFMRLFSGPIDAPRLINTSLRRCDYMLELLMGTENFKDHHKRCFDKQSWGKRGIWWVSVCLLICFVCCLPFLCLHYSQNICARRLNISLWLCSPPSDSIAWFNLS